MDNLSMGNWSLRNNYTLQKAKKMFPKHIKLFISNANDAYYSYVIY